MLSSKNYQFHNYFKFLQQQFFCFIAKTSYSIWQTGFVTFSDCLEDKKDAGKGKNKVKGEAKKMQKEGKEKKGKGR